MNQESSLLSSAADGGHAAIVRTLAAAGAKGAGPDAARALFLAAWRLDVATADALLETGADPNAKDKDWGTPLERARNNPYAQVAAFLRQAVSGEQ